MGRAFGNLISRLKPPALCKAKQLISRRMFGSDRVGESRAAHNVGNVALEAMANFVSHLVLILIKKHAAGIT
jgi:hypothetical protein